ncbi:unnamed protein product [Clavelina lepadiformis]|uniref:Uncharacterized protein n=1 Tax=Clavelina lepadiformis TaxID=159417 RepID=A0ABP0GF02_CLALP
MLSYAGRSSLCGNCSCCSAQVWIFVKLQYLIFYIFSDYAVLSCKCFHSTKIAVESKMIYRLSHYNRNGILKALSAELFQLPPLLNTSFTHNVLKACLDHSAYL